MRLKGKHAIVTGAASGIGWATVRCFLAEGAMVSCLDLDGDRAGQLIDNEVPEHRAHTSVHPVDVANLPAVEQAVRACTEHFDAPAILVNSAATQTPAATIDQLDPQHWLQALSVNLSGTFNVSRTVIPPMRANGGGAIVHIASQLGSVAMPGFAAYCASKGAILQLSKTMALDHAADRIRVNTVSPGATLTERLRNRFGSDQSAFTALGNGYPLGRLAEAREIAAGILYLASDDASFVTGSDLVIDGGYLAQ